MSEVAQRLTLVDLATIELMRTDSDYVRYCEGVDDRVDMVITAKFSKGTSAETLAQNPWMPRLIAERAKLYCEEVLSIPVDRHVEKLRDWFLGLGILGLAILFFLGLTTAIGGPKLFFDEQMNANVSWILLLMLAMFLISLISMIGVVVMLAQWGRSDFQKESTDSPKPTLVLRCVWGGLTVFQRLLNLISRHELNPYDESMRHLKTVANRQSYFASASALLAINGYMLLVTLAIWGAIYVFLFTNNVGYRFPNSTLSPQERAKLIAWFGRPVEFIWSPVPSIDAIAWAEAEDGTYRFDESLFSRKAADGSILNDKDGNVVRMSEEEIAAYKNLRFGEFRRQWSNFLVGCVLVWLITPRVLICAVSGTCMTGFYRDLLPDSKNERVRKIVAQVVGAGEHKVSHTPSPSVLVPSLPWRRPIKPSQSLASPEPTLPTFSGEICRKPLVGAQSSGKVSESGAAERDAKEGDCLLVSHTEEPSSKGEPGSVSTPARTTRRDFRIVGYELDDPSFRRLFILARLLKASKVVRNLNGAREQADFVNELDSDDLVIVVASLLATADDSFREFVEEIGRNASIKVVLTNGTAAREEYKDQPSTYELILRAWRKMVCQAGLREDDILANDLNTDQGVSLVVSALGAREFRVDELGIRITGRFDEGINVIHRHIRSLLSTDFLSHSEALQKLDEDLSCLYANEKQSFVERVKEIKPTQRIQEAISKVELPLDISGQCVRAAGLVCGGLLSQLPARWAIAGGLSGLAVGSVGGLAAVASGGVAVLPMLIPIVLGHAISGAGIGGGFRFWLDRKALQPDSLDTMHVEANDVTLARCGVIQTLIYELQGNSESLISEQIGQVTNRLDRIDPQTSANLLSHFGREMKEMMGR